MPRLSLVEQYDNKDVIQQILNLKTLVYEGTIKDINVTSSDGSIHFEFTMNDDSVQTFDIPDDYIVDVDVSQSGADVTLTFTFASGLTDSTTFNVTAVGYTTAVANTLAQRDGDARLIAADPASGATDGTLATTNWISQTGNSSPNNLLHRTGNEIKYGANNQLLLSLGSSSLDQTAPISGKCPLFGFTDKNGVWLGYLELSLDSTGFTTLSAILRNANGTSKTVVLGAGNP